MTDATPAPIAVEDVIALLPPDFAPVRGTVLWDPGEDRLRLVDGPADVPEAAEVLDGAGRVVLPGLHNAHVHPPMVLFRGLAEGHVLETWLPEAVWPLEAELSADDVRAAMRYALVEMARSGTTRFTGGYPFAAEVVQAAAEAGMHCEVGVTVLDDDAGVPGATLKEAIETVRAIGADGPQRAALSPHSIYACSAGTLRAARDAALELGCPLQLHVSETRWECTRCYQDHGVWPVEHLADLGLLGDPGAPDDPDAPSPVPLRFAHCSWLTKMEIGLVARSGARVGHCPTSNMKLASGGTMPLVELLAAGVPVGLGTDSPAANNSLSMLDELKFAALAHTAHRWDPKAVSTADVLGMATLDGTGLCLVETPAPGHDPAADLVFSGSRARVTDVVAPGGWMLRDGEVPWADEAAVREAFVDRARRFRDLDGGAADAADADEATADDADGEAA